ncbi:MAG: heme A synthase [Alphaproteobacteria bacterium]|nr:heme A synthase [Alphaproteobacteria bacterium]
MTAAIASSAAPSAATTPVGARSPDRLVAAWIFTLAGMVALMVIVGGATRLTDSGLSITEWAPILGALPPMSEEAWALAFERYKAIPEYELVNWGMSLEAFKAIYWWEWGHRQLGRAIGLAVLLPLIFFAARGHLTRALGVRLAAVFVLVVLQGALGWWMVSSGLVERIDVSQYRLAAHLGLALVLFGYLVWLGLDLVGVRRQVRHRLAPFAMALVAGVYLQMILGAFVAGLRAGRTFNTWPLMDGELIPSSYFSGAPRFGDLFETMAATQFNHRLGAYAVIVAVAAFFLAARRTSLERPAAAMLGIALAQAALGIVTVLNATPVGLGLAHQAGALALFAATIVAAYGCVGEISTAKGSSSSG